MDEASADAGIPESISALLLYVLFFFPAMAAVHTLVIIHDGRREKFALSSTVATPGTQLILMIGKLSVRPVPPGVAYSPLPINWRLSAVLATTALLTPAVALAVPERLGNRE